MEQRMCSSIHAGALHGCAGAMLIAEECQQASHAAPQR